MGWAGDLPAARPSPTTTPGPQGRVLAWAPSSGGNQVSRALRPSLPSRASAPDAPTKVRIKDGQDTRSTRHMFVVIAHITECSQPYLPC